MLNFDQANALATQIANSTTLTQAEKIAQLNDVVSQLDISASGKTTILYAGDIGDVHSSQIVQAMLDSDPDGFRALDDTQASLFLRESNEDFMNALTEVYGDDPRIQGTEANKFLFGVEDAEGKRITDGAWDNISRRFVLDTTGEVRILTESPRPGAVLLQTEIPALIERMESGDVTTVSGVSSSGVLSTANGILDNNQRIDAIRAVIRENAKAQTELTKPTISNFTEFSTLTEEGFNQKIANLSPEEFQSLQSRMLVSDIPRSAKSVLTKLGPIGGGLAFVIAATEAGTAAANGDVEGAEQIMKLYAVDLGGSLAGEFVAGAIATLGVTIAGVAGVAISAPVAGAVILGAAIVGGFFGADSATDMFLRFQNLDDAGKEDFIDQVIFVLLGEYNVFELDLPEDLLLGDRYSLNASFTQADIIQNVQNSIAWRYALVNLNTFVIDGNDDLYAPFNQNGELDLDSFSEEYISDRALMLYWRLQYDNAGLEYNEDFNTFFINGDFDFVDKSIQVSDGVTTEDLTFRVDGFNPFQSGDHQIVFGSNNNDTIDGESLDDRLYGNKGDDTINGNEGKDYIEGNDGIDTIDGGKDNDTIHGNNGADILIGGTGSDTLKGGDDNANDTLFGGERIGTITHIDDGVVDTLEGGDGDDTYYVGQNDIVNDSDRNATIEFNGVDVSGEFKQVAGNTYENETAGLILTIVGNDATIRKSNDNENTFFTIRNFKAAGQAFNNGDFGITLNNNTPEEPEPTDTYLGRNAPNTGSIINFTENPDTGDIYFTDLERIQTGDTYVELPGSAVTDQWVDKAEDVIQLIEDLEQEIQDDRDQYLADNGSLAGYEVPANLQMDLDNAREELLERQDRLLDQSGASLFNKIQTFDGDDDVILLDRPGFAPIDHITTGAGFDLVIATEGDQLIEGGDTTDLLIGGEGNDQIYAVSLSDLDTVFDSDNVVAGEDRDWLSGGDGDDTLIGSTGQNGLAGGAGNDLIAGGAGDDLFPLNLMRKKKSESDTLYIVVKQAA